MMEYKGENLGPSRSKLLWLTGLKLVLLGVGTFCLVWMANPWGGGGEEPLNQSGLFIKPESLYFGETWETSQFKWTLPIENQSGEKIDIEALNSSCNCLDLEPRSLVIEAGRTRKVVLSLNLTPKKNPDSEWHDFEAAIWPRLRDQSRNTPPIAWKIRGKVHNAIRFEQSAIDLGRHSELAQPIPGKKIAITSFFPLKSLKATSSSANFSVLVNQPSDAPNLYELFVSSTGSLPQGPIQFQVTIFPQSRTGEVLPQKMLQVAGRIVSDFQVSPPGALFGGRQIGEVAEETVTIHSLSHKRFEITGVTVEAEGLSVEKTSKEGAGMIFLFKQTIKKKGEQQGRVDFQIRTAESRDFTVVFPTSYLGLGK